MKIHQVGGSIRDTLVGLPAVDRDDVVVGATVGGDACGRFSAFKETLINSSPRRRPGPTNYASR